MELSQEDKDRILAEEKYRMEARSELRGSCGHGGGCCCGHRGWRIFPLIALVLGLFALSHVWHHRCGASTVHGMTQQTEQTPAAPTQGK